MAEHVTHEMSPATEEKFRRAIADALNVTYSDGNVDAVLEQITDLIVAVDANADTRGYERGFDAGVNSPMDDVTDGDGKVILRHVDVVTEVVISRDGIERARITV